MMSSFLLSLENALERKKITEKIYHIFLQLYGSYTHSLAEAKVDPLIADPLFNTFLQLVEEQLLEQFIFLPFHQRMTSPFNYYQFGIEFIRPLVDPLRSQVKKLENVEKMQKQLLKSENVVLFANHQTEVDPQLISIALENSYPDLAAEMIFVAGDRVITDPMAIPFSMGRNLLCIYSKRHIETPPEKKSEKLLHNQRTMKRMKELLSEGGRCIYMAPSGGRDRLNEKGEVEIAPFDSQSVEMFRLMALQAEKSTHFYPLALATYDILPPPQSVEQTVGERRKAKRGGVHFSFGDELQMDYFEGSDSPDRHARRAALAQHIWNLVKRDYNSLKQTSY